MEAELWQGHPKEPEGWETTIYLTYGATAVLLAMALGLAPDTSIKTVSFILNHYLSWIYIYLYVYPINELNQLDLLVFHPPSSITHIK